MQRARNSSWYSSLRFAVISRETRICLGIALVSLRTSSLCDQRELSILRLASTTMDVCSTNNTVGGLSHLVEAATALAELTGSVAPRSEAKPETAPARPVLVSDEEESRKLNASDSAANAGANSKREIFPQRLMMILNDPSLSDVVTWLPHGRSFVIIRPDVFTEKVLPKYLPPVDSRGSTKYASFTRKLNRW